jgi:hypothetical protein
VLVPISVQEYTTPSPCAEASSSNTCKSGNAVALAGFRSKMFRGGLMRE